MRGPRRNRWWASLAATTYERPFGRYLEDFTVGDIYRHWPGKTITVSTTILVLHDHDEPPSGARTSGSEHETVHAARRRRRQPRPLLVLGMGARRERSSVANLEVESLTHKKPTFHGDTIYAETRVLDVAASSSKPDRGIVTVETKGFNQRGEEVCYFRRKVMVWKRDAAPVRRRPYDETEIWT
jgi:acyl dehydratase